MARRKKEDQPSVEGGGKKLIAKKDWRILCGSWDKVSDKHQFDFRIKAGDDVSDLPAWALKALKSESVI